MKTKIEKTEAPLVSIVILTYNHEKYIAQALEGVLTQKVNFEYEIIVSNDCSTDNTDAICQQYAKGDSRIRYHNHEHNIGVIANHQWSAKQAKGKYIAYCDGDDYWIDDYKLQRQVDFMETHPEYSLCYHNVILECGENRSLFIPISKRSGIIGCEEVINNWAIPTSAVVYRRDALYKDIDKVIAYPNDDYAIELFLLTKGVYYYDISIGAVYREHSSSVSAGMNANSIKMYEDLIVLMWDAKLWFPLDKQPYFEKIITYYQQCIHNLLLNKKYPFLKYFKKSTYKRWLLAMLNSL